MGKEVQPSPRLAGLLKQTHGLRRIALTTHRRENFGDTMVGHLQVLRRFVESHPDTAVIFPVHPNPNVRKSAESVLGGMPRIHLTEPLDYGDFVALMSRSWLIASDSGGVQEEAPSLGVPLIVLREKTERPEAVEAGVAKLAGTPERFAELLADVDAGRFAVRAGDNPFGQGDAAQRIVQAIRTSLRLPNPERTFAEATR
jgi:UDP-N-acetylglucosamine 2-epimerase (non-hydrolysing)